MLYIVEDEKGEIVDRPGGGGAIFLTEAEATTLMIGHPKWTLRVNNWRWS
jgi:hypothetical protein